MDGFFQTCTQDEPKWVLDFHKAQDVNRVDAPLDKLAVNGPWTPQHTTVGHSKQVPTVIHHNKLDLES